MNDIQPHILTHPGRIVVIGDIHGDIDRLLQILIANKIFTKNFEWIAEPPNTVVIQLGDQIDSMDRSGVNSDWDTSSQVCANGILDLDILFLMDKLDNKAKEAGHGGRVISLIGNHEFLNIIHQFAYVSPCSMKIINPELRKDLFARGNGKLTQLLAKRNIVVKIGKYIFCHGGIIPDHLNILENIYGYIDINLINQIFRKFVLNEILNDQEIHILKEIIIGDNGILWTRFYMDLLMIHANNANVFDSVLLNILSRLDGISMFIGHNIVDNITSVANSKLFFTDAALSRAFNTERIQVLEIITKENGEDTVNLIELNCNHN